MQERAFVPRRDGRFYLLQAHRQPLPDNVAAHFIETLTRPGDLIVDPFVASDAIVRAALERGRRIIGTDSNPLVAWATKLEASVPNAREIQAALLRLGDTRKEGESLRASVEKLYASQCAQCGGPVVVDFFVRGGGESREKSAEAAVLKEKIYTCPNCGTRRDDATAGDRQRAKDAAPRGLSYHVLVQRLLADDAANTRHIKRLLDLYTLRNQNALAAVTQKFDTDFREDAARYVLAGLLLHALDTGTALYPSVGGLPVREIPEEFVEVNIWRALEAAARGLGERGPALRLAANPAQVLKSTTPAAFIGQGGARYLAENVPDAQTGLILSSPARLDPAFWELSFLWTRWLLGKNAAASLEPLLDDKRQRWSWYGEALTNSFADVAKLAPENASLVVAFPSGSHAMIEALMLAVSPSFALEDFAFRPERGATRSTEWGALRGDYQAVWRRTAPTVTGLPMNAIATRIRTVSLDAAREILDARNEPLAYSWLHHAGLQKLARDGVLAETLNAKFREGDNAFQYLRHRMEEGFKEGYIQEIDHWEQDGRVLWMRREEKRGTRNGLARRAADVTREILAERQEISADELEDRVLAWFGGLLTPEIELIEICARAYADFENGKWVSRPPEEPGFLVRAGELAARLGKHLNYQVDVAAGGFDLIWHIEKIIPGSASGAVKEERFYEGTYAFRIVQDVDLDALVAASPAPLHGLVILPETRVELTRERLRRDPRWHKRLERAGWEFLRVPMLEFLLQEDLPTRPEFRLAWGLDPALEQGQEQMQLL